MFRGWQFILAAVVLRLASATTFATLYTTVDNPNTQYRFTSTNFIGAGLNFSGVGYDSFGSWATMISPDYFVSAAHDHPNVGDSITFYSTNSTSGPSYTATVSSYSYQPTTDGTSSDLWIGKLTTPIPSSANIASYPILNLPASANYSNYYGLPIYVYGSPNKLGTSNIDQNGIVTVPDTNPTKLTEAMQYSYYNSSPNGENEAYLQVGDSGGPSFSVVNGSLALVGEHYYNSGDPPGTDGSYSGDTFLPYYISQINTALSSSGEAVAVVPEPTAGVLLGAIAVLALCRRRRSLL